MKFPEALLRIPPRVALWRSKTDHVVRVSDQARRSLGEAIHIEESAFFSGMSNHSRIPGANTRGEFKVIKSNLCAK